MNRQQTIMSGIDLSPMKWLSGTEDFDARSLASRLVLWMTEDVLWKLVKRMFHVTETTFGRNELFYYRVRQLPYYLNTFIIRIFTHSDIQGGPSGRRTPFVDIK